MRGARSRTSRPASPDVASSAAARCSCAAVAQPRISSRVAFRGAMSGSPWPSATAAWSPAVSVPRSAAISVANSRLTSPGASDPLREGLGQRLERVGAVGHELLEHRDRGRAIALGDHLGEAGEAGDRREAGVLAQERRHLEVRVEAGLEPAERLEQERVPPAPPRCATGPPRGRAPGPARQEPGRGEHGPGGPPGRPSDPYPGSSTRASAAMVRPSAIATASVRHVPSPGAATRSGSAGQREAVSLADAVVEPDDDRREDVRTGLVEDERLLERRLADGPALGAEPARPGDRVEVERRDRRGDLGSGGTADVSRPC